MRRPDVLIPCVVLLALFVLITRVNAVNVSWQRGDAAVYMQAAENIAHRGVPVSQLEANVLDFIYRGMLKMDAAQIKGDRLLPPPIAEYNELRGHEYFILYPIGLLTRLLPTRIVLAAVTAGCFVGLLGLAFYALRRSGVSNTAGALMCLLVLSHPAWTQGLLFGQFYPDRVFLITGFVIMFVASRQQAHRGWLLLAALLCVAVHERAALIAGISLFAYVLVYWRSNPTDRAFKLGTAIALVIYGFVAVVFIVDHTFYAIYFKSTASTIERFQQADFLKADLLFIIVNAPLLLLAFGDPRAGVIAVVAMLPNIVGTIGGAEKTGWSTHYHSYYFPILVWAATAGFAQVYRQIAPRRRPALAAGLAVLIAMSVLTDPNAADPPRVNAAWFPESFFPLLYGESTSFLGAAGKLYTAPFDQLREDVPEGSVVSTTEAMMPTLYHNRTLRWYPIDIDRADFVVIPVSGNGANVVYGGITSSRSPDEQRRISDVVIARMRADGYDFASAKFISGLGVMIVRRRP